jgi:hypothetical protein
LKQKLQVYALWAEILGGIAILVSLLFVGIQLRQSNALATTDALKEGTERWTDAYVTALGTEESTAFFTKAINRCGELSKAERGRFFAVLSKFVSAYDNIFNQYESGRLREEVFVSIAFAYYSIANTACAQRVLSQDFLALPTYLLGPSEIEVLSGREGEIKLPDFLVE